MTEINKYKELIISATVFPDSRKFKIIRKSELEFEVYLKEPAQNNLANKALIAYLAEFLGVNPMQLQIISGHKKQKKKLKLTVSL